MDYYKILGIRRDANSDMIKKAYHKMARKYHPDKNPENKEKTTEMFKNIKEAYEVLSDPERRRVYNTGGVEGIKRMNSGASRPANPFNMFNNMFRGGGFNFSSNVNVKRSKPRGSNVNHIHYYTLEDLYRRVPLVITYDREKICVTCKGLGVTDSKYIQKCETCGGKGMVHRVVQIGPGMIQQSTSTCGVCRGRGQRVEPGHDCGTCGGLKKCMGRENIRMNLPRDLCNGSRAVLAGHGNEIPDGITGDLEIQFREKPHSYITRCGNHLLYRLDVQLNDALLGFNHKFVHLDGRELCIVETGPLSPKSYYIIPGEGLNGGDLYIRYNIIFPREINDSQRSILESIFPRKTQNIEGVASSTIELNSEIPREIKEKEINN